jgi:signal transduction histidine kinase
MFRNKEGQKVPHPDAPDDRRRLESLYALGKQLSQMTDLDTYLKAVVEEARHLTQSEAASIILLEPETNLLKFVAAPPQQIAVMRRVRVPLENSIAGQCFRESRPIVVQDAHRETHLYREVDQLLTFETRSLVAVPLIHRQQTIGVVEAVNKQGKGVYAEEDVTYLAALAVQAALVIRSTQSLEQLQRAAVEIKSLDKRKADFIAIASHELRTPLGLIIGHATELKSTIREAAHQNQVGVILDAALRLKSIIEDLFTLDTGRESASSLHRKVFSINSLVQYVIKNFSSQVIQKRISLIPDMPDKSQAVDGDAEKIAIALSNLVKNAITFTNEGGHVLVCVENLPGFVKISVVDDGIGIPAKDMPRIFERFYQVESHLTRKHGGMGLGLSVAKVMVELHGGQIWVESAEGYGSNFSILLPAVGDKPRPDAALS